MKKSAVFFLIIFFFAGCDSNTQVNIPDADFVYQTIRDRKDVLGFYTFVNDKVDIIDIGYPLQYPMIFNQDYIIGTSKEGNFGSVRNWMGRLEIVNRKGLAYKCSLHEKGYQQIPDKNSILFSDAYNIYRIDSENCKIIETVISREEINKAYQGSHISSFTISNKGDFVILSLLQQEYRLYKIALSNFMVIDMKEIGTNASISPDDSKVAYLGDQGIMLWELDSGNKIKLIDYKNTKEKHKIGYDRGVDPKPMWSHDGNKLIYHKCLQDVGSICEDINDYAIFTYDLATGVETEIIVEGINPSWIAKE